MRTEETTLFGAQTLGEIADLCPQSVAIFEEAGIDFSCKGLRSIAGAAASAGYELGELRERIESAPPPPDAIRWSEQPLDELTRFLVGDHLELTMQVIPALRARIERAIARHPSVAGLRRIGVLFEDLKSILAVHTAHEERDLFTPFLRGNSLTGELARNRLSQRVLREFVEHESFNERLETLQTICLRLPIDAADLQAEIDRFARIIRFHMHLENNILYPRAIELEKTMQHAS
jgi:regulator of cell morphogenesis and NO signaling